MALMFLMPQDQIPWVCLFLGHTWKCSGLAPGFELRDHTWQWAGDHMECWKLNPGWLHARKVSYLLSFYNPPFWEFVLHFVTWANATQFHTVKTRNLLRGVSQAHILFGGKIGDSR